MNIRSAIEPDFVRMWPIFQAVVSDGTTYVFSENVTRQVAFNYWFGDGVTSFVAEENDRIIGMYKIIANQCDRGSHVANASFMIDPSCSGRGVGKTLAMHCLQEAKQSGYLAMQFNFVVSTNDAAIALWKKLGFKIVGTLPKAFLHQQLGYVDALVMHRFLDDIVLE